MALGIEPEEEKKLIEAMTKTIASMIVSGGKKSDFKKKVSKALFKNMGSADHQYKLERIEEVNNMVDFMWNECHKLIASAGVLDSIEEVDSGKSINTI